MPITLIHMHGQHSPALVATSIVVAMVASFAALELASRVTSARASVRVAWLLGGSAAMGVGIWSMHFIAMLAFRLPISVTYDLGLVLLSMVAAIAASGTALYVVSRTEVRAALFVPAGVAMGIAISGMHYIGMAAMRMNANLSYEPTLMAASIGIAITASFAALWLAFRLRGHAVTVRSYALRGAAAVVMGLAIAGMHYTAMGAARFIATSQSLSHDPGHVLATPTLTLAIAVAALMVLVIAGYASITNERTSANVELARLAAIVASSNDAIISANHEGLICTWNAGAERLYGYTADEVKGRDACMLTPSQSPEEQRALLARVGAGELVENFETVRRRKDGTLIDVSITLSPIPGRDGRMIGISTTTRDITERRRSEQAMQDARRAAESANRAKSEFLANMSHEIRTPMNGVLGMLDLALDTDLRPEQRDYVATAKSSAESLLTLINDILDFSKIEAGKMTLERRPFGIRALLSELMRPLELRAAQKGLRLSIDIDPSLPELVVGDSNRIRQILVNLLGNAIKFTSEGEVTVRVEADTAAGPPTPGGPLHAHFVIRDTGIGISPDKQRAIFEAFVQADASTTREHGGTGLGLAIAANLVSLMGGHIRVESEVGQGSTFYLTLLLRSADDLTGLASSTTEVLPVGMGRAALAAHPVTPPLRILLADDNAVNQKFLGALLMKRKHLVVAASTGREVLEAIAKAEFDLILMDVHMPELGGFETTALIRAMEEGTDRHIPIIAVTARAMVGDRERCLEAGMDDYLSKPIHLGALYEALARWAPSANSTIAARSCSGPLPFDRDTLLSRVDGDDRLLAELVALFAEESPRLLGQIRDAITARDSGALQNAAHALKGSALSMAMNGVAAAANSLERMGDDGTLDRAPEVLIELEEELQRSIGALNAMIGTGSR